MRRSTTRTAILLLCVLSLAASATLAADRGRFAPAKRATAAEADSPDTVRPIGVVARFLDLVEPQLRATRVLVEQKNQTVAPLARQIARLEEQLEEQLSSPEPNPAAIGHLLLQIRERRMAIRAAVAEYRVGFNALLDDDQAEKMEGIRRAKAVQPILPAFEALGLI